MAHLLRIVMIHGHLSGVVELSVDGHTNICGTNASGKTTLQRLVPVFYGELLYFYVLNACLPFCQ